jgi:nitrogen-specific signal transduction histidine kinase/CheY-like chemotaxis protein
MASREVLIVEDDANFRTLMKRALASDRYSFVEADSVDSALRVCNERQGPRVILLDLDIPGGSGKEFLLRLGSNLLKYRIIVLTAHEEFLAAELAREFQVFRYLHKPSRLMESLRFTVSQAFNDLERAQLKDKNDFLNQIQHKINLDIQESKSNLSTQHALNEVLTLICESVMQLLGAYTVHIRVYDLQKGDLHLAAFAGPNPGIGEIFNSPKRKGDPLSGTIASEQLSIHFEELQREHVFQNWKEQSLQRISKMSNPRLLEAAENYFKIVQSAYVVPITTGLFADETDAVFNISADEVSFFVPERQAIIKEFVGHATTAITKAWQKLTKTESHKDYRNISKVLEDISKALRGEHAKTQIYDIVIKGIAQIIKPETISIFLHNKATGGLDNEAEFRAFKFHEPGRESHSTDQGLTAFVYTEGTPLRLPNLQVGDRRKPANHEKANPGLYEKYVKRLPSGRVDHYLAVPMIIGSEVIGAVQLLNKTSLYYQNEDVDRERWLLERGFSDDCENVLGIAASHLAVAIRNAELLEERRKQINQLAILKDVGRFRSSVQWKELLSNIISEAATEAQAEICLLFLLDDSRSRLVLGESYGIPKEELAGASYEIGEGCTGEVVALGESRLITKDVPPGKYDEQILRHLRKSYGREKQIESLMIVPIKGDPDVIGVIKIINKKGDDQHYSKDDLKFFETFASYVGLALENKQDYEATVRKLVAAQSNSTLSSLVTSVAHEVNHTFGLIPDDIQELKDLMPDRTPQQEELLNEIDRMATQMVYYSNEISGYHIGDKELVDINEVVAHAVHQIPQFRLPENMEKISLKLDLFEEPLECSLDEGRLVRSIRNIVINAYQALEGQDEGEIVIRTYKDIPKMATIEISDNGSGIDEAFMGRIYDPHFTTKKGKGTGIGLWLVKTHIDSISGSVKVFTRKPKGTTFKLGIPLESDTNDESTDV